jgi:hypothetical protein
VIVGREPSIYSTASVTSCFIYLTPTNTAASTAANEQTNGIPNQRQQKQSTRTLALATYRTLFAKVEKWNPSP